MELYYVTSIQRLIVVIVFVASVYLSFCDAVSQNGVMPGTCIGDGGFDDSCPTGMYCDEPIGGTCVNCSKCYTKTFSAKEMPLKCRCDSTRTGSSAICQSISTEGYFGDLIESERDVQRFISNSSSFSGYFDGSQSLQCPEQTTPVPELTTHDRQFTPSLSVPSVQDISYGNSSEDSLTEQCKDPGDPINGYKKHVNHTKGGKVEFECYKSYFLQGRQLIYCMEDGEWSDKVPTCDKEKIIWLALAPSIGLFVVMVALGALAIYCYRHKVRSDSMDCIASHRSDAENPSRNSNETSGDDNPSESIYMLPELSESNSEETTGSSSSSGTKSGSHTPDHTSAVYLTDGDLAGEPLVSTTNNQQSMELDSVHSSSMGCCTEKLTEGAWTTMRSSLITLLEHEQFKKVFLQKLFMDTLLSEDSLNNICSLSVDGTLITAVREQTDIQERDSYGTMGRILMDSSLRSNFPEKGEIMMELMKLLSDAHKTCPVCNDFVQECCDNSTAL